MALSQCTFTETSCGPNQEFTKEIGDSISEIRVNNEYYGADTDPNASVYFDCPYKLHSTMGAPGFAIDLSDLEHNNIEAIPAPGSRPSVQGGMASAKSVNEALMVSWVEYDYNTANLWQDTTWPDIHDVPAMGICDGGCAQGDLWTRRAADGHVVSASSIITALEAKRQEIEMYELLYEGHNLIEQATPWSLMDVFGGMGDMGGMMGRGGRSDDDDYEHEHSMDGDYKMMHQKNKASQLFEEHPTAPHAYEGNTFENTSNMGGYGSLTSGIYSLGAKNSGFKAHGSLGQGADGLGATLDTSAKDRYMIVTLTSTANHDKSGEIKLQLGAFPFANIDTTVPVVPVMDHDEDETPMLFSDASITLALGAGLAASTLSLF